MIAIVSCAGGCVEYRIERTWDGLVLVFCWSLRSETNEMKLDSVVGSFKTTTEALTHLGSLIG